MDKCFYCKKNEAEFKCTDCGQWVCSECESRNDRRCKWCQSYLDEER